MTVERQLHFVLQPLRSILTIKVGPTNLSGRFSKTATHTIDPKQPVGEEVTDDRSSAFAAGGIAPTE
jgi:hypothetical protein